MADAAARLRGAERRPRGGAQSRDLELRQIRERDHRFERWRAGRGAALDAIDTVMWLFGFSVAKAGEHVMYGDALTSFGFALDAECKNNPSASLMEAVTAVRPNRDKPMDLTTLNCAAWETRHAQSAQTDAQSASTIMMWLYGFSVGRSGGHLFDTGGAESSRPRCKSAASSTPATASSTPCRRQRRTVGLLRRRDEPPSDCTPTGFAARMVGISQSTTGTHP